MIHSIKIILLLYVIYRLIKNKRRKIILDELYKNDDITSEAYIKNLNK